MIENYVPDIYQKSIYYINYDKLIKRGIKCLLFDLDNTITPYSVRKPTKRQKLLFDDLKNKGFKIIIVSNSPKYRVEPFKEYLNVDACAFSFKPNNNKYERIMARYKFKPSEMAAIGDKLSTDILGANKRDITSILVNPLSDKEPYISFFRTAKERRLFSKLNKRELFIKGKYYE